MTDSREPWDAPGHLPPPSGEPYALPAPEAPYGAPVASAPVQPQPGPPPYSYAAYGAYGAPARLLVDDGARCWWPSRRSSLSWR